MTDAGFWIVQGPGRVLFVYLVVAQCTSAFDYCLGVRMGTQEPAERTTEVVVAVFRGFAGADLVHAPLLAVGLVGHFGGAARGAPGWSLSKEAQYLGRAAGDLDLGCGRDGRVAGRLSGDRGGL